MFEDESLVPSDILAGLILLSHKARREKEEERVSAGGVTGNTVFHNMGVSIVKVETEGGDGAGILEIVREGERIRLDWSLTRHFYSYAAASYGYMWWLMQVRVEHSHWSDPSRYCALIGWDRDVATPVKTQLKALKAIYLRGISCLSLCLYGMIPPTILSSPL